MKSMILAAAVIAVPLIASAFEADDDIQIIRWYAYDWGRSVWFEFMADTSDAKSAAFGVPAKCIAFDASGKPIATAMADLTMGKSGFAKMADEVARIEEIRCQRDPNW